MHVIRDPAVMARIETAFDLYDLAEQMMRQNLRRRFPDADAEEIERRLLLWLQKRAYTGPLAELGQDDADR